MIDIKAKLSAIKTKLLGFKQDFLKAETYVKSVVYPCLIGGATTVHEFITHIGQESSLFTHEGILILKQKFLYGAGAAFIALFIASPLKGNSQTPPLK